MKWQKEKTFIYGRTRSFSLIGSALSSSISIVLVLIIPMENYIFLFSTIPYILDFILIITYDSRLDISDRGILTIKDITINLKKSLKTSYSLKTLLWQDGLIEATIAYLKSLIQPIIEIIIIGGGIAFISNMPTKDNLKVTLGIIYTILNLFGAFFSKRAYILTNNKNSSFWLKFFHRLLIPSLLILGIFIENYIVVCLLYVLIYIIHSIRKPIFVDEIDNQIAKSTRATFLSIASALKSIILMLLAPLLGYIADTLGITYSIYLLAAILTIALPFLIKKGKAN